MIESHMPFSRERWPVYLQPAALTGGGILIMWAATLGWKVHYSGSHLDVSQANISLALGGVALFLGVFLITELLTGPRGPWSGAIAGALGLWLSLAVVMLPLSVFREIEAWDSTAILGFLPLPKAGPGIWWTVFGGVITGAGSIVGIVQSMPTRSLGGRFDLPVLPRPVRKDVFQIGALLLGGLVIVVGTAFRWQRIDFYGTPGVEFSYGQIAFVLSGAVVLLAAILATFDDRFVRRGVTVLAVLLSATVVMLAFAEGLSIGAAAQSEIAFGLVVTMIGGTIAAIGALAGLLRGPSVTSAESS